MIKTEIRNVKVRSYKEVPTNQIFMNSEDLKRELYKMFSGLEHQFIINKDNESANFIQAVWYNVNKLISALEDSQYIEKELPKQEKKNTLEETLFEL
jgi:hypothetical protein